MADIDFTTSLNDKGFTVGLKNIEKEAKRTSKAVDGLFKLEVLTKITQGVSRLVTSSMQALARESADAADFLADLQRAQQDLLAAIGRELLPGLRTALDTVRDAGSTVAAVWRGVIDTVQVGLRVMGGQGARQALDEVISLRLLAEQNATTDRAIAELRRQRDQGQGIGGVRKGSGDVEGLLRDARRDIDSTMSEQVQTMLRLETIEQQRLDRHIELDKRLAGMTASERQNLNEAEARLRIDQAAAALSQQVSRDVAKQQADLAKANAEREHAQVLAVRGQLNDERRLEIENMRLAGMGREAEMAERRLEWAERLWAVEENSLLGEQEKVDAKRRLLDLQKQQGVLLDQQAAREMERRMGWGGLGMSLGGEALANLGLSEQVFGPPVQRADSTPMAAAAAATAKNTARTAELLEVAIDRYIFGPRGAVFQ